MTIRDVIGVGVTLPHRGDPDASIEAWEETGFKAGEVDEWLSARCFDPDAAEDMDDLGITIEMAAMRTGAGNGGYVDTVGYQVAVGDLGLEEAGELVGVRVASASDASSGARHADLAPERSRYGRGPMTRPDALALSGV